MLAGIAGLRFRGRFWFRFPSWSLREGRGVSTCVSADQVDRFWRGALPPFEVVAVVVGVVWVREGGFVGEEIFVGGDRIRRGGFELRVLCCETFGGFIGGGGAEVEGEFGGDAVEDEGLG